MPSLSSASAAANTVLTTTMSPSTLTTMQQKNATGTTTNMSSNMANGQSPNTGEATIKLSVSPLNTSTGARPKVPQSCSTSISMSLLPSGSNRHGSSDTISSSIQSRMKRSPRFSSFDSQASLAEYTGDRNPQIVMAISEARTQRTNQDDNLNAMANLHSGNAQYHQQYGGKVNFFQTILFIVTNFIYTFMFLIF